MRVTLRLPLPPPVNHMYRVFRGRIVKSSAATRWQTAARLLALEAMREAGEPGPAARPVRVTVEFQYRARRRGDLDGPLKCLLDGLNAACYDDDRRVVALRVVCTERAGCDAAIVTVEDAHDRDETDANGRRPRYAR